MSRSSEHIVRRHTFPTLDKGWQTLKESVVTDPAVEIMRFSPVVQMNNGGPDEYCILPTPRYIGHSATPPHIHRVKERPHLGRPQSFPKLFCC